MKRLTIITITLALVPCYVMAQFTNGLGMSKEKVRKMGKTMYYVTKSETDTCDSYRLVDGITLRVFYKAGIGYKVENVFKYSFADMLKAVYNREGENIGENAWIIQDGTLKVKLTADKNKDQCILDFTAVHKHKH
jgi:hypothetical protein